jgi:hypothetical protein
MKQYFLSPHFFHLLPFSPLLTITLSLNLLNPVLAENGTDKITFDLSMISEAGLIGDATSLRAMNYEFCIPAQAKSLATVQKIDPSLIYSRSPGRIGCQKDQYLCIGSTHQPQWREVLLQLAALSFVEKIAPFWGE